MPRAGLNRDRVIDEAAAMVDELGLAQLTLAGLAERLGVRQPSLYKHIESIADLRRGIALMAVRQLGEVLSRAAVGRSGAQAILSMSRAYRDWAMLHPAWYEAAQVMPAPDDTELELAMLASVQTIADVLTAYDLQGDDAIDAIRAFRSSLHGFVIFEAQGAFAIKADINRSFERMVQGFIVAVSNWAAVQAAPAP